MLDENELLFDKLYEKTKDCGRTQFIRLLMSKERENQQLKDRIDKAIEWVYIVQQNENNKHLEPIISIDELDELLELLKGEK